MLQLAEKDGHGTVCDLMCQSVIIAECIVGINNFVLK